MQKKLLKLKNSAKTTFYNRMLNELIEKDHKQWYSQLKRLPNQGKTDKIIVKEISHLGDREQAESIADHISAVSQEYTPFKTEDFEVPKFNKSTTLNMSIE